MLEKESEVSVRQLYRDEVEEHGDDPVGREETHEDVGFREVLPEGRQYDLDHLFEFLFMDIETNHTVRQHLFQVITFNNGCK